jgi:putative ATPase
MILWGPPGCGKTTIARLLARGPGLRCEVLSAVTAGVKEIRETVETARREQRRGLRTVLVIDEIHRLNRAQQDALLPHVEAGTVTLIGATTENPSFEVIAPLLSRCRVFTLARLEEPTLQALVRRAAEDPERGLGKAAKRPRSEAQPSEGGPPQSKAAKRPRSEAQPSEGGPPQSQGGGLRLGEEAPAAIAAAADGDARRALGLLEAAAALHLRRAEPGAPLALEAVREAAGRAMLVHDRDREEHYNVVSALIKSLRASDPDAALYYAARMLAAGEDPRFLARRLVIFASEDVGNAEPAALPLALAAYQAVERIGMPEGRIVLGQAVAFLASAPKSNAAYLGIERAGQAVAERGSLPVPMHLRNAPTGLMKGLGYGRGYEYPHDAPERFVATPNLPEALRGERFYEPTREGAEAEIADRLAGWRKRREPREP